MESNEEIIDTSKKKKTFRQKTITDFLDEYYDGNLKITDDRIKLCSSDDFNDLSDDFRDLQRQKHSPIMISQVGGFYVMASLAGYAAVNSRTKPVLLFFDKKTNNIANAIYNTLLMQACNNKERYVTTLFGLDDKDIIKSLDENKYISYIVQVFKEKTEDSESIDKKRLRVKALRDYAAHTEEYDKKIAEEHDLAHRAMRDLEEKFSIPKLAEYAKTIEYDPEKHSKILTKAVSNKLNKDNKKLFDDIAESMISYLSKGDNYKDLVDYLSRDVQKNYENHILCDDELYEGYRSLINSKGQSSVKFVPGVDISTDNGINKLERILSSEKLINDNKPNAFPIDVAFLPHIDMLQNSYPFLKKNVERFIKVNRGTANNFTMHPTASLNVRTYESIGAEFIEDERKNRKPLTHLVPLEQAKKGFPLITFMPSASIGNIYNSETDMQNIIDMAIADGVDTVYVQGLIYSTYYHKETDRRQLSDPKYETLDQRLKAAKKLIKKLNDNGIKVVYQMGDEEENLYQDMFKIYTREQGVKGNNFLRRDDLKSTFDDVKPIIKQDLIPYLIRRGEDLTNFYTDEEKETRVSELCHALKNYKEGLPLGDLAKYIKPEYLKDTEMFRVVPSTVDQYDKDDPTVSVNVLSNPNFSSSTQYADPTKGVIKKLNIHQTGALANGKLNKTPQLFVDGRQAAMTVSYRGDQVTMNVPQMVDDSRHENTELLAGIKESIKSDPTHKRMTQKSTDPNYPGSWTITGDSRYLMTIVPYWRRSREVMEHVNKTGEGLEEVDVLYFNDIQAGSLTERLEYSLKALDHFMYDYPSPKGIFALGDFGQGWNYKDFANEQRHLGTMSVAQQMVDIIKLFKPWIQEAYGVVSPLAFVGEHDNYKIDKETSLKIIEHLRKINVIDSYKGINKNTDLVKNDIDYKTVDLQLPPDLAPYEKVIREKLLKTLIFKFIHIAEGNHEYNSDWDKKGFNLVKFMKQKMEDYKDLTGSEIEISQNEFIMNRRGDILQSPIGSKTINGYNIAYSHLYKGASGDSPTRGMAKQFERMGELSNGVHRAVMGHLHVFETSVINNKLYSITGCGAGQSGFEQNLGLSSKPLFVVDRYLPDGRLAVDTIGTEFLKDYQIQNPLVKEIGLENFINACLSEEVGIYGFDGVPENVQPVHQRKLVIGKPSKVIGPKID